MLKKRLNMMLACFLGCVVAALLCLLIAIKLDSPFLALVVAGMLPAGACFCAGLRDRKMVAKIVIYATVGWALTFMLAPQIGQSPDSRTRRIADVPLVGKEWYIPSSLVSTLLAMVGATFIPNEFLANPRPSAPGKSHVA